MAYGSVNVPGDLSGKQDTLVGTAGQIVGFNADGAATPLTLTSGPNVELKQEGSELEIGAVVPGKNLLINWDFRKPVNRNGKTEYIGMRYTIDRWRIGDGGKLTIENSGISFTGQSANLYDNLRQTIEADRMQSGKTYTFSLLYKSDNSDFFLTVRNINPSVNAALPATNGDFNLVSVQFVANIPGATFWVGILRGIVGATHSIYPIAAKLELGPLQTLARQNEDGEWEIIDPPDYDLQYLLCSQYSPSTGEWVGSQHSNTNLLDNWYFADPINQRGQTEYNVVNRYTIDRWHVSNAGKVTISDGYITIQNTGEWTYFIQRLESGLLDAIRGKDVTISALTASGELKFVTIQINAANNGNGSAIVGDWVLDFYDGYLRFFILNNNTNSLSLIAVKLELGPVQTLAHKEGDTWVLNDPPPNKALELAKCQRYYWKSAPVDANYKTFCFIAEKISGGDVELRCRLQAPATMRARPAIRINGISPGGTVSMRQSSNGEYISGVLDNPTSFTVSKDKLYYIWLNNYTGAVALGEIYEGTVELDANL